jgi:hypothetical protein
MRQLKEEPCIHKKNTVALPEAFSLHATTVGYFQLVTSLLYLKIL